MPRQDQVHHTIVRTLRLFFIHVKQIRARGLFIMATWLMTFCMANGVSAIEIQTRGFRVNHGTSYFVDSDGVPILWLGDTWWFCPSMLCPIDGSSNPQIPSMFKELVDLRASQGFNVVQLAFLGASAVNGKSLLNLYTDDSLLAVRQAYWQDARRYVRYANEQGLAVAVGVGFHRDLDKIELDQLKALWQDLLLELGQFNVVWFIAGEYNVFADQARIDKVEALIAFIRQHDRQQRLITLHPAAWRRNALRISDKTHLDFTMVQSGHGAEPPPVSIYSSSVRSGQAATPVVEAECRYDGIYGGTSADDVRACMVRAIMAGAAGFSYGAHGLWYQVQSESDQRFKEYGAAHPWWVAMRFPGAAAVGRVKRFFEGVQWWKMAASPGAMLALEAKGERQQPYAMREGQSRALAWFPGELPPSAPVLIQGLPAGGKYCMAWIHGRLLNVPVPVGAPLVADMRWTALPDRPGLVDWFLMMRETTEDVCAAAVVN